MHLGPVGGERAEILDNAEALIGSHSSKDTSSNSVYVDGYLFR